MIKVSVFYQNGEGKTFDVDYYSNKHIPMIQTLLGSAMKAITVEKGLAGGTPDAPAPYAAMANLYFDSVADFQNSFGPQAEKIMADLPNYTNSEPLVQISEVLL